MLRLTEAFGRMPGIGRKTAERLTYYVLRAPREKMETFAGAIMEVKNSVRHCSMCHNITEQEPCAICADTQRKHTIICVVEEPKDLFALEGVGVFRGVYHVLTGHLAPLEGIGPDELTISSLVARVSDGGVEEVIMATNPNLEGDGTALHIRQLLEPLGVKVTRLARGLAAGAAIEYANSAMLDDALSGRSEM